MSPIAVSRGIRFRCDLCTMEFKTKAEELRHEIRVHYCNLASCPICSKK